MKLSVRSHPPTQVLTSIHVSPSREIIYSYEWDWAYKWSFSYSYLYIYKVITGSSWLIARGFVCRLEPINNPHVKPCRAL
jgi:hypothetical protein